MNCIADHGQAESTGRCKQSFNAQYYTKCSREKKGEKNKKVIKEVYTSSRPEVMLTVFFTIEVSYPRVVSSLTNLAKPLDR